MAYNVIRKPYLQNLRWLAIISKVASIDLLTFYLSLSGRFLLRILS